MAKVDITADAVIDLDPVPHTGPGITMHLRYRESITALHRLREAAKNPLAIWPELTG